MVGFASSWVASFFSLLVISHSFQDFLPWEVEIEHVCKVRQWDGSTKTALFTRLPVMNEWGRLNLLTIKTPPHTGILEAKLQSTHRAEMENPM